jgi:iron-sulfur cluster repair protein YtfE (RIC family)
MDATKMLEADHREAEELIAKIKNTEGPQRKQLVDKLASALQAHMTLEERVLYPSSKSVVGAEEVEEAENEHKIAKDALRDLVALSPDEPGVGAAIDMLAAAITHHVKDEEKEFFPKLRHDGEEVLRNIATPFMQTRAELGMPMPADALASAMSKTELVEEAKHAGIEHVSSMKKDELAEALARKMAS